MEECNGKIYKDILSQIPTKDKVSIGVVTAKKFDTFQG